MASTGLKAVLLHWHSLPVYVRFTECGVKTFNSVNKVGRVVFRVGDSYGKASAVLGHGINSFSETSE